MTEALALEILAQEFAANLTDLTRGVLGEDAPRFHAVESGNRVRVELSMTVKSSAASR